MIIIIQQYNAYKYSNLLEQMFELRARIFGHRLAWDVQVENGKERDKYDDEGPVYVVYTDDNGRTVKGSLRLLPTTGPTLLADFFSDTLPEAEHLSAPTIWECTRFCLDDKILDGGRDELFFASAVLISAMFDVALNAGIESIVGNFDASVLPLLDRLGCEVEVLGSTSRYGRPVYLGLHHISKDIVCRVKGRLKNAGSAFAKALEMAA